MKYKILLFLFLIFSVQAQMISPSFFPQVKSINPASIATRSKGQHSLTYQLKTFTKDTYETPSHVNWHSKVDINSVNYFMGSKGGSFNFEIFANSDKGKIKKDADVTAQSSKSIDTVGSSSYFGSGLGVRLFPFLSIGYKIYISTLKYTLIQKYGTVTNGIPSGQITDTYNDNYIGHNIGSTISLGAGFAFGGYYYDRLTKRQLNHKVYASGALNYNSDDNHPFHDQFFGTALGFENSFLHIELAHESNLKTIVVQNATDPLLFQTFTGKRQSALFEIKLGPIAFGYKWNKYFGSYYNQEDYLNYKMIYENFDANRIDNVINFAYAPTNGHSLSGSISSSKETKPEILQPDSSTKYDATTKSTIFTATYSYLY